jgi:hypothetical protein
MPYNATGRTSGHKIITIKLPPDLFAVLNAHRYVRDVPMQWMIADILGAWAATITDYEHPIFSPETLGCDPPAMPPNRYKGYLDSLGFITPEQAENQAPPTKKHDDPSPVDEEDLVFQDVDEPVAL